MPPRPVPIISTCLTHIHCLRLRICHPGRNSDDSRRTRAELRARIPTFSRVLHEYLASIILFIHRRKYIIIKMSMTPVTKSSPNLSEIDEYCLEEILKHANLDTLLAIAQTSQRLQQISRKLFQKFYRKSVSFYGSIDLNVLRIFGEQISVIQLIDRNGHLKYMKKCDWLKIKQAVKRFCVNLTKLTVRTDSRLDELKIFHSVFPPMDRKSLALSRKCESFKVGTTKTVRGRSSHVMLNGGQVGIKYFDQKYHANQNQVNTFKPPTILL